MINQFASMNPMDGIVIGTGKKYGNQSFSIPE